MGNVNDNALKNDTLLTTLMPRARNKKNKVPEWLTYKFIKFQNMRKGKIRNYMLCVVNFCKLLCNLREFYNAQVMLHKKKQKLLITLLYSIAWKTWSTNK